MKRFDLIDGIRGMLALTVMLSHFIGSTFGWSKDCPFVGAYLSVIFFFIMNGFVLSYSHPSGSFFKYFLTRLARLWPLYLLHELVIVSGVSFNENMPFLFIVIGTLLSIIYSLHLCKIYRFLFV